MLLAQAAAQAADATGVGKVKQFCEPDACRDGCAPGQATGSQG